MEKKSMGWKTPITKRKIETEKTVDKKMKTGGGVDDHKEGEMTKKQLDEIKNAKPGDIVKVQSKWLPYKLVSVKVLEPFKQINPNFYENFYAAYGDYDGSLEMIAVDYEQKVAFIGGNWEEEVDDSEIIKMARKYNLKHHHMEKGGGVGKMARGGYLEGREEYEGYKYLIWYRAPKGYSVSGDEAFTKKLFDNENVYFDSYEDAKEHAEISIRSMLLDKEEMAKGGGVDGDKKISDAISDIYTYATLPPQIDYVKPFKVKHDKAYEYLESLPNGKKYIDRAHRKIDDYYESDSHYYDSLFNKGGGVETKGKTNKEISDMYWQKAEDIDEEINSDRGGESSGPNWERIERLEKERDKYRNLAIKYDSKMRRGGGVEDFDSNIHIAWSTTKKITNDIRSFIFESYEAAGDELAEDVIAAIEQGIELAKMDMR